MMFSLAGKVAVVTGAARGIGRASALALARAGADVVGIDIAHTASAVMTFAPATKAELDETGAQVMAEGRRWRAMTLDQRDIAAVSEAADAIARDFGRIDILHANAGVQGFAPLVEMTDADWHDQIDINLTGTANMVRVFARKMMQHGGRMIITSSTQGQHGTLNGAAYSASKWGLIGLMKSAALELGRYKITVNALVPGLIDTALTRHEDRYAQAIEVGGKSPSFDETKDEEAAKAGLAAKSPLGVAWISPDDVAPAVVFLASDEASMVSGTSLAVTAGDSANVTA